jgi:hypothetical protein
MGNADHVFKSSTCLAASFCSHGRLPIGLTNYQGECPAIDCAIEATRGARLNTKPSYDPYQVHPSEGPRRWAAAWA